MAEVRSPKLSISTDINVPAEVIFQEALSTPPPVSPVGFIPKISSQASWSKEFRLSDVVSEEDVNEEQDGLVASNELPNGFSDEEMDFDYDIAESYKSLHADSEEYGNIYKIINDYWNDIFQHQKGQPGLVLAENIKEHLKDSDASQLLCTVFDLLDDVRTSLKEPEEFYAFIYAVLKLREQLKDYDNIVLSCNKEIKQALMILSLHLSKEFTELYAKVLDLPPGSEELSVDSKKLSEFVNSFKTDIEKIILNCIVNITDCYLCNKIITDGKPGTAEEMVMANTNLSTIQALNNVDLPRFRQALLLPVASDPVLKDESERIVLVPLLPVGFIACVLSNVSDDMECNIDMKAVEEFAKFHGIGLNGDKIRNLLVPGEPDISKLPMECSF